VHEIVIHRGHVVFTVPIMLTSTRHFTVYSEVSWELILKPWVIVTRLWRLCLNDLRFIFVDFIKACVLTINHLRLVLTAAEITFGHRMKSTLSSRFKAGWEILTWVYWGQVVGHFLSHLSHIVVKRHFLFCLFFQAADSVLCLLDKLYIIRYKLHSCLSEVV
jgi:hypothetical protein